MNKCLFTGKNLYEVVPIQEYTNNINGYLPKSTCIDFGQNIVLPVISDTDKGPGIVIKDNNSPFAEVKLPDEIDYSIYESDKILDFTDSKTMKEFMDKQTLLHKLEKDVLSSPDNIFSPQIEKEDAPAMKLLKQAVISKNIDLDKYESRFGSNYSNDKRLFNKNNISLSMITRVCDALDIKATLTLEDQNGDIANPMREKISIEITEQGGESYE